MYIGTHYNSYYNSLFGDKGSTYSSLATGKTTNSYLDSLLNTAGNGSSNSASAAGLKYVQALKEGSSGLNAALSSLSSGSAFKQNAAVSSNTEALTVQGGNSKYSSAAIPEASVKIDQVAAGQSNQGTALKAAEQSEASGYQQFAIETNGRAYQFSVNIAAGDTNKDVQQRMAAAINQQNIGVTATVSSNAEDKTSTLKLSAQSTGENAQSSFSIRDVYGSAVAATGAANISQQAQNASYILNGGPAQSSQSNTVNLGNGVTATLKQASENAVTVSQGKDTAYAKEQINNLVKSYNELYGAALDNSGDAKANRLFSQLVSNSKTYASSLSKLGLEFDSKGYMQVNDKKFQQASESGSLERFFTENRNTNYGYTNQLSRTAQQVNNNTANYVSQDTLKSSLLENLNSNNYLNNSLYDNLRNFYQQSNNSFASGLLYDFLL